MGPGQETDEPIPASLVAHHVFCPRRAWLEAAGERTDTAQMAAGTLEHRASDDPTASRPGRWRSVDFLDDVLGVVGRCDGMEQLPDGTLRVVETKATPVRRRATVTEANRVQVGLQVFALRDNGYPVSAGAVHFVNHATTVDVPVDEQLRRDVLDAIAATRAVVSAPEAPAPLVDDPRCGSCSHLDVCLPGERRLAPVSRRILVDDPDSQIVHLTTPGARASTRRGRLVVTKMGDDLASVPLESIQGLVVHGNVDVSSALLRELLWRDLAIVWCSGGGRVVGWARSTRSPNGHARPRQHLASANGRLDLAREFVGAKIANQATLLRRALGDREATTQLRALQRKAGSAGYLSELFGIEGEAAATFFEKFPQMIRGEARTVFATDFPGRQRRPATDILNASLNYAYGLLLADVTRAVLACGLDPHAGFLHSSGRNKPALALDLMEEFRTPIADSTVLRAINNGELKPFHFSTALTSVRLREAGRKALVAAYEQRVTSRFRHPTFGYEVTWRRAMEIQARLVLGVLDGTQPGYIGIRTR